MSNSEPEKSDGWAKIKVKYIDTSHKRKLEEKYLPKSAAEEIKNLVYSSTEGNGKSLSDKSTDESNATENVQGDRHTNQQKWKEKREKKKLKGRNKVRPTDKKTSNNEKLCPSVIASDNCDYGDQCRFIHSIPDYLKIKPESTDGNCYLYETFGKCDYGVTCMHYKGHTITDENYKQLVNDEKVERLKEFIPYSNRLSKEAQVKLWKRKYDLSIADRVAKEVVAAKGDFTVKWEPVSVKRPEHYKPTVTADSIMEENPVQQEVEGKAVIDFKDKLYLAPLTTVGNLPFRRICKEFGVDITCSEMATSAGLLQGHRSEWALLKRHYTEDLFGVQICGPHADMTTRAAQLIMENTDADFIDINCGCPIDLFFRKGEGCGLMAKKSKLYDIVNSMQRVMNVPLTVKMRTGVHDGHNNAHKLVRQLRDKGVAMVTLHGRTREQRYTRLADWDYINQCVQEANPMPIFGNGDILSYEDYNLRRQETSVSGCMIARGALMKPWIFTEIKEQRHWDISAQERFEILKKFTNYGLEHWGSDNQGVQSTRRFLLEWMSFLYRYIPVGILERVPQKINEKPPRYFGRNDLETLLASPNCADWIKLSEMLLGPVQEGFQFLPKHKANAYQ